MTEFSDVDDSTDGQEPSIAPLESKEETKVRHQNRLPGVRVMAALSMPRICFSDMMMAVLALPSMNIDVRKASGAFWEQSLSQLLYYATEHDYDYVLTVDYDSIFKPVDVFYMIKMMTEMPDAAAIFPLQYRRGVGQLILSRADGNYAPTVEDFAHPLVPAVIGHFGCTVIRVESLRKLPHPWLHSRPNAEGRWDAGKKDADILFWEKIKDAGMKVYCATRCVIGHVQEVVTWPGEDLRPYHQYIGDYFRDGDVPEAVKGAAEQRLKLAIGESNASE